MTLPVAEVGKLLFGARRAKVTRLAFVYCVSWIVGVEGKRVEATSPQKRAGLAAKLGRQDAGAN